MTTICQWMKSRPMKIFCVRHCLKSTVNSNWFNSCNDSLFAGMTLALHKSQLHCSGVMQWWAAVHACRLICLLRQVAKLARRSFGCSSLLRNNYMATNLQMFTSSYDTVVAVLPHVTVESRHLWQAIQRDSETADSGKPRSFVLCEKKHEWKKHRCANAAQCLWLLP